MKPNIYMAENELTSPRFCEAFAIGSKGEIVKHYTPGPWAGFGSPQVWHTLIRAMKEGHDFYYGDHAYFGRGKFYRVTKNRFQHTGIGKGDMRRLARFYDTVKRWQKGGRHIVLCPQSDNHHERFGELRWAQRVRETLAQFTDRPIVQRKKKDEKPLIEDLQGAHCLITHTSNAAVEAILNGIPAICTGDCAASIMSLSDPANVEKPFYPDYDRLQWASVLASNQFTLDELRTGECWKVVNNEEI